MPAVDFDLLAIAALAFVSVGAVFYVFAYPYLSGEAKAEKRVDAYSRGAPQKRAADRIADLNSSRKRSVADSLKELEQRETAKQTLTLRDRIDQAGLDLEEKKFYMISAGCAVLFATILLFLSGEPIAAGMGLLIGGLGLPRWFLGWKKKRRIAKFIEEFPNAIDIIVRGIKSGLPLGDCLRIIASEARDPLKSEFRAIVEAQQVGLSVGDACARLFKRMPIQDANFFVIVIQIQQKAGGNLSEALSNLSRVLRERKKMKAKVQAMSMEAKASAWIIGSLPIIVALLMQVASPGFTDPLFITQAGHLMLLGSAFWMLCGIIMMKYMINFDI
jgi:tight adherence protein B